MAKDLSSIPSSPLLRNETIDPNTPVKTGQTGATGKVLKKGTMGLSPSKPLENEPKDWSSPQRKAWLSSRRATRLEDTKTWLADNGLLGKDDLARLAALSDKEKSRLNALLKVPSFFSEGAVKDSSDRHHIRAFTLLVAARTGDIDQAASYRHRLTSDLPPSGRPAYTVLTKSMFRDPGAFDRATRDGEANRLLRQTAGNASAMGGLAAGGLGNATRSGLDGLGNRRPTALDQHVYPCIKDLIDCSLLDAKRADRLRVAIMREPQDVNTLMEIDKTLVPDAADRQKIRTAVLLRAAEFGIDDAKAFKAMLTQPAKPVRVTLPENRKADAFTALAKDKTLDPAGPIKTDEAAKSGDADKAKKSDEDLRFEAMASEFEALLNSEDVTTLDTNAPAKAKKPDLSLEEQWDQIEVPLNRPNHAFLRPLDPSGSGKPEMQAQWGAITDRNFDPAAAPSGLASSHGQSADALIGTLMDKRLDLAKRAKDPVIADLMSDRADDIRSVLRALDRVLPDDVSVKDRMQALTETLALLTTTDKDGTPRALDSLRQHAVRAEMFGLRPDQFKMALNNAFGDRALGLKSTWHLSPVMQDMLGEPQQAYRKHLENYALTAMNTVFGDDLAASDKENAVRHLMGSKAFRHAIPPPGRGAEPNEPNDLAGSLKTLRNKDPKRFAAALIPLRKLVADNEFRSEPSPASSATPYDLELSKPTKAQIGARMLEALAQGLHDAQTGPDKRIDAKLSGDAGMTVLEDTVKSIIERNSKPESGPQTDDLHKDRRDQRAARLGRLTGKSTVHPEFGKLAIPSQTKRATGANLIFERDVAGPARKTGTTGDKTGPKTEIDVPGGNAPPSNDRDAAKLLKADRYHARDRAVFLDHAEQQHLQKAPLAGPDEPFYQEKQIANDCGQHALNAYFGKSVVPERTVLTAFAAVQRQMGHPDGAIDRRDVDAAMGNDVDYLPTYINWGIARGAIRQTDPVQTVAVKPGAINGYAPTGDRCIIQTMTGDSSHFVAFRKDSAGDWRLIDSLRANQDSLIERQPKMTPGEYMRNHAKAQAPNTPFLVIEPVADKRAGQAAKAKAMLVDLGFDLDEGRLRWLENRMDVLAAKGMMDDPNDAQLRKKVGKMTDAARRMSQPQLVRAYFSSGLYDAKQALNGLADHALKGVKPAWSAKERSDWLSLNLDDILKRLDKPDQPDVLPNVDAMTKIVRTLVDT